MFLRKHFSTNFTFNGSAGMNIACKLSLTQVNHIHFFYISNVVAKAPGLNLSKKLSDLLSNREALN